jgi:hypothetical protein
MVYPAARVGEKALALKRLADGALMTSKESGSLADVAGSAP